MDLEQEIQALLEKAAPLREFESDDPRSYELTGIVDKINELRDKQARGDMPEKKKPGRPRK